MTNVSAASPESTQASLLRMAGVSLGKRDHLGSLTLHPVKD
jgi:hypothetical protein